MAQYQVKVLGITLVPGVIWTGEDISDNVTLANNVDTIGLILQAGSFTISPNPTFGDSGAVEVTFLDTAFGNSNIDEAQYRLDGAG